MKATITRKSRNLGIAATAYANNGPRGHYFAPLAKPRYQGGCETIRRELADYRKIWSGNSYRVDLFVGGKRVAHDTGDYERLRDFCLDQPHSEYGYMDESITVHLDDE